ncbi:leucine-rich repeat domain-containing protein [Capnocytophaga stomatis]|uniref:Leucine-rich repeat domain-containing protein n=1 Tax=Capnocytophaga stomatis TaxID=1848904 RepID=A0ABW8QBM0_9FLAO
MGAIYYHSKFWNINKFDDFQKELSEYKKKIKELDRIQISGSVNMEKILPVLWEEIFKHHKSLHLRFFLYQSFDVNWIANYPELESISIEAISNIKNLEKLSLFKNLKVLALKFDYNTVKDLSFLENINPNLEELYIVSGSKAGKIDLNSAAHFRNLKTLHIENLEKNLEKTLSQLSELENLTLRSTSKPKTLDCISKFTKLKHLTLQLCGFENIDAAIHLKSLQYLQLWRLPKLTDLEFVSQMKDLQFLFIETLNGVTQFPKVADLQKLRRVKITSCKNITDFSNVEHSSSIIDFIIQNAVQTDLNIFIPILKNKNIQRIGIGYQKVATQKEVLALAQQCGREEIQAYMYPDFEEFKFQ